MACLIGLLGDSVKSPGKALRTARRLVLGEVGLEPLLLPHSAKGLGPELQRMCEILGPETRNALESGRGLLFGGVGEGHGMLKPRGPSRSASFLQGAGKPFLTSSSLEPQEVS